MTGLAVALLTFAVFSLAPSGGFLGWDDAMHLLDQDRWRGLGWENLRWMATTRHLGPWMPLTWLSWAADHALWGLDPAAFRRVNLLLHSAAAGLLAECARRVLSALAPKAKGSSVALAAAGAALFFALHPLRVESVVWITQRRDVLSGALLAGSLLAWLERRRGPSLALFAGALLSKTTAVALPWFLLLLAPALRRKREESVPYFALALAAGLMALWSARTGDLAVLDLSWPEKAVVALHGLAFYAAKTLWPAALSPYYPLPASPLSLWPWAAAGAALTALALLGPLRPFWLAYALALAPVSGLLQNGRQAAADRYSYLSCLPFALLAGLGLLRLRPAAAKAAVAAGTLLLAGLTLRQASFWRDDASLWARAVPLAPDAYLPRSNYALALDAAGDAAGAEEQYRAAIRLEPRDVEARVNLGALRGKAGDAAGAEALYREALALRPGHAPAHFNLAFVLRATGRKDEGLAHLREALRLEPALASRLGR